jgi:hypothetical protein
MNMRTRFQSLWFITAVLLASRFHANAQGTAFTYQGRLNNGGNPANGNYDFTFAVFNASNAGSLNLGPITNAAVTVSNGLFTTVLDFGNAPTGNPAWLEIAVRTNNTGNFSALSPRQQLLPVPTAMFANTASNLSGSVTAAQLNGALASYSGAVAFANGANSFSGNGRGLANVDAATLGGLATTNFWGTDGNSGTSPTNGNFLGTADNQPLEFKVNGQRALRLEPTTDSPNVIGGYSGNFISAGSVGAAIGGGGAPNAPNGITNGAQYANIAGGYDNTVSDNFGAITGGHNNNVLANSSFIGGGFFNTIQVGAVDSTIFGGINNVIQIGSYYSTIGSGNANLIQSNAIDSTIVGGISNMIQTNAVGAIIIGGQNNTNAATYATIGGGSLNLIQPAAQFSFIGGGIGNTDTGVFAMIPGGTNNSAAAYAFAAGSGALATNIGAFVWSDSSSANTFNSTASNQFLVRAAGGVGINTNNPGNAALNVNGAVVAKSFSGDGSGLTGIVATSTNTLAGGTMSAAFNFTNTANNFTGTFTGNGSGLTGINATLASGNVSAALNFTNAANTFTGAFSGNGANLTGINPASLTSGTASSAINFTNNANTFTGTFSGDGSHLTNLPGGSGGSTGANFVYAYDSTTQPVSSASAFQDLTLNTVAQLNGWTHAAGSASFTNNQTGLYLVEYSVEAGSTSSANSTVSVIAVLNGTEIPGSQASIDTRAATQNAIVSKSFIVGVSAGNTLKLQFTGTATSDRLTANNGSGTTKPSASLTVIHLQ